MKIVIEVHHVISVDPQLADLLKTIFPAQATIDALEAEIKAKTEKLSTAIEQNS